MKQQLLMLIIAISYVLTLPAQVKTSWGKPYKEKRYTYLKNIVGYDENGFYTVVGKGAWRNKTALKRYDESLNFENEVEINDNRKGARKYHDMLTFPNQMYVLYTNSDIHKKDKYELYARSLDSKNLTVDPEEKLLHSMDIIEPSAYGVGGYSKRFSADSSTLLLCMDMPSKNKKSNNKYKFLVYSDDFTKLWEQEHEFPYQDRFFYLEDAKISNEGNVYCIGRIATSLWQNKRDGTPNYSYHIYYLSPNEEEPVDIPITITKQFITDIRIDIAPNGDILCAGFYSKENTFNVEGVFSIIIDGATKKVKHQSLKAIPISTIVENMSEGKKRRLTRREAKGKNVEMFQYDLDDLLLKKDGGFVLVGEQFYIQTYTVTYNRTTVTHYIYNYNDIFVVNVSPQGEVLWAEKIGKRQITEDDGGAISSYSMIAKDDKLHFIYNDNINNMAYDGKGLPDRMPLNNPGSVMVTMDKDGKIKKDLLFTRKETRSYIMPSLYQQTAEDELVIYGSTGKKKRFLKLKFE